MEGIQNGKDETNENQVRRPKSTLTSRFQSAAPFTRNDGDQFCWHWNVGKCGYGDECIRAKWHTKQEIHFPLQNETPLLYNLFKVPRERDSKGLLRRTLEVNNFQLSQSFENIDLLWTNNFPQLVNHLLPDRVKINHFPGSYQLTHKDNLCKNLSPLTNSQDYQFVPLSFVIPENWSGALAAQENNKDMYWIIKPSGLGEGRGVTVREKLDKEEFKQPTGQMVVQQYIAKPLLVNGFKIDFRIYVLVTSVHPTLDIYLYRDGVVRFASAPYSADPENLSNSFMHLCNNSVNRQANATINGTNWTVSQFRKWMDSDVKEKDFAYVWNQFKHVAAKTVQSIKTHLVKGYLTSAAPRSFQCFQLFGFDVLLDSDFKCWILEVNSLPDLSGSSKRGRKTYEADFNVKSNLLVDLFSTVYYLQNSDAKRPVPQEILGNFEFIDE